MSALLVFLIIVFSVVLIKSADITVIALKKLVNGKGIIGISAIIIAIGTSFPELFVGITSAFSGKASLSLGVALGSNIANIALIGAGAALLSGTVSISGENLKKIIWISFACGILPYLLLLDGYLGRSDGLVMIFVYLSYILYFFPRYKEKVLEGGHNHGIVLSKFVGRIEHFAESQWKSLAGVFIGISLMLFSADTIVKFSTILAERVNIPIFVIGLFVLAIGTSLPEFAFSLRSLKDGEPQMFIGNLLGSIVANTTLIIGLSVFINPVVVLSPSKYLFPGIVFVFVYLLFCLFIKSKKRLDRWEAAILVLLYIAFFLIELL